MSSLKFLLLVVGFLFVSPCSAQFNDSFADGDFHSSPRWSGDTTRFVILAGKLKLQAPPVSGAAQLVTPSNAIHQAEWNFTVQLDFTPSSTNYTKVYLMSDQQNLQGPLNGYFVKVGGTSREVSLFRQSGTIETELIDGLDDRINQSAVVLRVKVTRIDGGDWILYVDAGTTGFLMQEGEATDATHTMSAWFGVHCAFTSTRSDKFWFDDFVVTGDEVPDTTPPSIESLEAPEPIRIDILFDEPVSVSPAADVNVQTLGRPVSLLLTEDHLVQCLFASPLTNGVTYSVSVSGFSDPAGNAMPETVLTVRYFVPGYPIPKAVLITEIFSDPSPQVSLPSAEYVEIYNASPDPFDLKDWSLSDGSSVGLFPGYVLLPGEYVVVTSTSVTDLFGSLTVIGVTNFPSLNNAGDNLRLRDHLGLGIDSVSYSLDWFRDEDKAAGGWSLELIDTGNPCGEGNNWAVSEDARGGTPGEENSVRANKPDLEPPVVLAVRSVDSLHVVVSFDEILKLSSLSEATIKLFPPLPVQAMQMDASLKRIEVTLSDKLLGKQPYQLQLEGVCDCNGNQMEPVEIRFGLPEPADSLDVLLSEVLFNPRLGGVDFVEIFNASEKFIDLERWTISNGESSAVLSGGQLGPKEWVALSSDPVAVQSQYPGTVPGRFQKSDMPSLSDDEGTILLYSPSSQLMDQLSYRADWHSSMLQETEGVSLERIDFLMPSQMRDNWVSAGSHSGFATPGLPNSNQRNGSKSNSHVIVVPEIFSPGSTTADFVQIHYRFDQPGSVSTVRIYTHLGQAVKELANNATLGSEGFLRWDGDREDGSRAAAGYYVLWFEYFDPTGYVETIRKRIILAAR